MKNFELDLMKLNLKLKEGSPVIFPTDTLPALGIFPKYAFKLWDIKKRPLNKPLILMGASKEELFKWVDDIALQDALEMAKTYWPGALTMVLPASREIVNWLNPGGLTIGMRVPAHVSARKLLEVSGPLATTSANISGEPSIMSAEEAHKAFSEIPLLGPIPWEPASELASTVIEWESSQCWKIIRRGAVIPNKVK